ncbi:MAG: Rieske (2Fe-2S) protein [Bryobacterales bacterium]|nr:Rieske (2Fe-2S) protein [Bryobacterales bacterium]
MSLPYRPIQWNESKVLYDAVIAAGIIGYLLVFAAVSLATGPRPDLPEAGALLTRASGSLAILMLHALLAIGPLSRLHPGFIVLLANRRHLGVATFLIAGTHGALATVLYHSSGAMNPLASILIGNGQVLSPYEFPFEVFGFAALLILAVLAATSHDFWIACLGLARWKRLHMLAYLAYVLLLMHTGLGTLQSSGNPIRALLLAVGAALLIWLHWKAARIERAKDAEIHQTDVDGWLRVCRAEEIPENRAVIVNAPTERVAVFRHWQGVSAISNVCAHQGGPLGEGVVEAGCVRCPWHGALYFPHTGASPPPYPKAVATFNLRVVDGVLYLHPTPNPPGTAVEPAARPVRRGSARPAATAPGSQPASGPKEGS